MKPVEIKTEIEAIRKTIADMHASKPMSPEERILLLGVMVSLRLQNEVIER